ncbi:MAG: Fe-S protein assembly co-chaperone HscB [Pusillimonas sp.]|nr:Fe-S protein assembly co-chaperone HscB [Pusillimonas sp.]
MSSQNYFELFGFSQTFALDAQLLETRWRELAGRVHPDRFASAAPAEKRVAMQWASTINEGYRVLKQPLARARYLCELAGGDLQTESNTRMDGAFLMRQMEWREALDQAKAVAKPEAFMALDNEIKEAIAQMQAHVAKLIDEQNDLNAAAGKVREWMFLDKLLNEIQAAKHELADRNQ